jgi:hypothetical protein
MLLPVPAHVQRTDVEKFLVSSLATVQREVAESRSRYLAEARTAHRQAVRTATRGGGALPPIRTFGASGCVLN